jgi:GTPase SAR1 family protein
MIEAILYINAYEPTNPHE